MAQVRLVQVPIQGIQIGTIGATLNGQAVNPGIGVQLGKFNNTTGTFYRDPSNPSGGGALQQIQVGTNISNRTLGYIVGTGTTATTTISTQTLPGAGYFSIWNNGNVQQSAINIQVPNCTGTQAKAQGSISNQPAVNQPAVNQPPNYYAGVQQPLQQQPPNYYAGVQQPLQQQPANYYAGVQQPLQQQPANFYAGRQQAPQTYYGNNQPGNRQPGGSFDFCYFPGTYQPGVQQPANYWAGNQQAPNYYAGGVNQPFNQQPPNYYAGGTNQPANQQAPSYYAGVQQPANQQPPNFYGGNNQAAVNQPLIQTPAAPVSASGALYNGSLVNPGQIASQGFALYIPNIGTLTTQGGILQGTGAGGGFQAPGTYTRTASAAVNTQQGIVNFQGTTRN
jgi:hypothetical protein